MSNSPAHLTQPPVAAHRFGLQLVVKAFHLAKRETLRADKVLMIALIVGFIFCLNGITSKYMHPDQMAFLPLFNEGKLPFNPGWFEKPPFHTYFNYFLSVLPLSVIGKILNLSPDSLDFVQRMWSRLLTAFLFLGSIGLIFRITEKSSGLFSARMIALIFATTAGFVAYSHFLTADIPVMFWMLLAFYFSHNILFERKLSNYLLAGVFTGIATATKYNGLAIGLTIVVAHFLSFSSFSWQLIKDEWQELFFSKKLILGLIMVVIGFVVGSPFSVLDYHTFTSDFMYNYMVAPVYEGQTGHSYAKFFSVLIEILGLPAFLLFSIAALVSLYLALSNKELPIERDTVWLSFSVLLIYYLKFAPFPRLETRFVLPIVPLLLIMSAPFWNKLKPYKMALSIFLVGLLGYNLVCSFYVGQRFLEDPRVEAEAWVRANMPSNSTIESDIYSPGWNEISGVQVQEVLTPYVTGRERLFRYIFKGNTFINGSEDNTKEVDEMVSWYSLEKLTERQPDFVVIDSLYYHRFTEPGLRRDLYPSMNHFYQALLNEEYPYEIVFDQETRSVPVWIYPQDIDFLHNRITIFGKK